jgi:maleylacetate reductase
VNFTYASLPARVIFGAGSLGRLEEEIDRLRASRALVLCTPNQLIEARAVAERLGQRCVGVYERAVMHVPIETARDARAEALRLGADCAVAIGGGSTIGLGKAIALENDLPVLAIPTTYAGSEMTPIYGVTEAGIKKTGRDPRVLPRTVIYDPELTLGLPVGMSVTSGMNAIAHACEGLYAPDANPVMSLLAVEGISALAQHLPSIVRDPGDREARVACLYGAWLCGTVLGHLSMSLHHKLCHTLGGTFNLPHAETHSVVLPHVLAYNRDAAPEAMRRIAGALGAGDAARGMHALAQSLGAPRSLRELGMPRDGIDRVIELTLTHQYANPRALEADALRRLLEDAWEGNIPV